MRTRNMTPASIGTYLLLQALATAQFWFAFSTHTLTASEMRTAGVEHGLPLVWHSGIWSDVLLVSPLAAFLVHKYSGQWSVLRVSLAGAFSVVLAFIFGRLWSLETLPNAHSADHRITLAGMAHLFYMAIALTIFASFYIPRTTAARSNVIVITVLLVVHLFLGTLLALGVLKSLFGLPFFPQQTLQNPVSWGAFIGGTIILILAGWRLLAQPRLHADN